MRLNSIDNKSEASFSIDDSSDGVGRSSIDVDDLNNNNKNNNNEAEALVTTENLVISRIKYCLFAFLFITAIVIGSLVYYLAKKSDEFAVEEDFVEYVDIIFGSVAMSIDLSLASIDNFIVNLVSHAAVTNSVWPYVTIPNYPTKIRKIRTIARAVQISQSHFVPNDQRLAWENFTTYNNQWVNEIIESQEQDPNTEYIQVDIDTMPNLNYIHNGANDPIVYNNSSSTELYLPMWQNAPLVSNRPTYNQNMETLFAMEQYDLTTMNHEVRLTIEVPDPDFVWLKDYVDSNETSTAEPIGIIEFPIIDTAASIVPETEINTTVSNAVGIFRVVFFWRDHLSNIFIEDEPEGVFVVFENDCNTSFTYLIYGPEATYVGPGDLHDPKFDHLKETTKLTDLTKSDIYSGLPVSMGSCETWIALYPSSDLEEVYQTNNPQMFCIVTVSIFFFTSLIFILYDCWVESRQRRLLQVAEQSSAILSSLFPSNVRDRLFPTESQHDKSSTTGGRHAFQPIKTRLKSYLENDTAGTNTNQSNSPIADFFPESTVLFADISGFTAWSSMREPTQVFILLESLYGEFDKNADRRGVFKVETIGDSYVAVTGVPEARKDHALVMTKFANDCRTSMISVTERLENTLGPDTGDLKLRIGLHSGPVTAGVLRGAKSRFQLFGDTVNTASRMESNGVPGKIQVSQSTADYLVDAGKEHWLVKRDEMIVAKGKGKMQTYFAEPRRERNSFHSSNTDPLEAGAVDKRQIRHINWACDMFEKMIAQVIARRELTRLSSSTNSTDVSSRKGSCIIPLVSNKGESIFDQVTDVIELPEFNMKRLCNKNDANTSLNDVQRQELRSYVTVIASMYRNNPFHNFEHATHVTMSVVKLLGRIIAPDGVIDNIAQKTKNTKDVPNQLASSLHDHTYGITSDPLTQFACVFSSFIHDVDHTGVPNTQLANENKELVAHYKGRSVAEQNSVDVAWRLLMRDEYTNLVMAICGTEREMLRFRQLVINSVLATDIMDKELNAIRNKSWDKAFQHDLATENLDSATRNRRATIIIEHIIQASDVAHTMQHWHIYRMWNERLFEEMYLAYQTGRSEKDPSEFWYQGELNFFDYYIIPLTKKLHNCGVFGVSSQEYMNYAIRNREEWEARGKEIVATMIEKYKRRNDQIFTDDDNAQLTCGLDESWSSAINPPSLVSL